MGYVVSALGAWEKENEPKRPSGPPRDFILKRVNFTRVEKPYILRAVQKFAVSSEPQ